MAKSKLISKEKAEQIFEEWFERQRLGSGVTKDSYWRAFLQGIDAALVEAGLLPNDSPDEVPEKRCDFPECRCNGDNVCQAYISGEIVNYCDFHTEHEMGRYENHVICPVCHCHFGG